MKPDPAIDDIREVRRKISAEFGHDPRRLMAHYMQYEKKLEREGIYHFAEAVRDETQHGVLNDKPSRRKSD